MDQSWQPMSARASSAVAAVRQGRFVVFLDDADREGEANLIMAAGPAIPECQVHLLRHTPGIACVAATGELLDELGISPMIVPAKDRHGTAVGLSLDAAVGVGTAISATDRARTVRLLGSLGPDRVGADARDDDLRWRASWPVSIGESR